MDTEKCCFCGCVVPEGRIICPVCELKFLNKSKKKENGMIEVAVKLNTTTDVSDFVNLCSKCVDDVSVYSGRYIVNGKSLMGLYSLDLSNVLKVEFYGDIPYEVKEGMKKFIVN